MGTAKSLVVFSLVLLGASLFSYFVIGDLVQPREPVDRLVQISAFGHDLNGDSNQSSLVGNGFLRIRYQQPLFPGDIIEVQSIERLDLWGPPGFREHFSGLDIVFEPTNGTFARSIDNNYTLYSARGNLSHHMVINQSVNKAFRVIAPNSDGKYLFALFFRLIDDSGEDHVPGVLSGHSFRIPLRDYDGDAIVGVGFGEKISAQANRVLFVVAVVAAMVGFPTAISTFRGGGQQGNPHGGKRFQMDGIIPANLQQYRTLILIAGLGAVGLLLLSMTSLVLDPTVAQAQAAMIQAAVTILLVAVTAISVHATVRIAAANERTLAYQKRPFVLEIVKDGIKPLLQVIYRNIINLEAKRFNWQHERTESSIGEVMLDPSGFSPFHELIRENPRIHDEINACNIRLHNLKVALASLSSAILTEEFVGQCRSAYEEFARIQSVLRPPIGPERLHLVVLTFVIDNRDRADGGDEWYLRFWDAYKPVFLRFRERPEVVAGISDVEEKAADLLRESKELRNILEKAKADYRREYALLQSDIDS